MSSVLESECTAQRGAGHEALHACLLKHNILSEEACGSHMHATKTMFTPQHFPIATKRDRPVLSERHTAWT